MADRHGVARGLIYQWLRQVREGRMSGLSLNKLEAAVAFAPVRVEPEERNARPSPCRHRRCLRPLNRPTQHRPSSARSGAVEIRLANGRIIKVDECIAPDALTRLLAVVDGGRS